MRNTRPGDVRRGQFLHLLRTRGGRLALVLMLTVGVLLPSTVVAAPAQNVYRQTETAQVYTVQPGDSLGSIAMTFGVSQEALMQANMLRNPNMIYVGQQLIIPDRGRNDGGTGGPVCADYYTVRRGDTLSGIAWSYGLDGYALARANGLYDLNEIYVGQKLCIPASKGTGGPDKNPGKPAEGPQRPVGEPDKHDGKPMDGPQRPVNEPGKNPGKSMDGPQRPTDGPQRPMDGPDKGPGKPMDGPQRPPDDRDRPGGKPEMRPTEYWKGTYFTDKYFSEFALERQDLEVNFNWGTGSPFGNSNENRFSARWEKVEFFKGGVYTFYAIADDGVRVYVDDQLIIDGWKIQPATEYKADVHLGEGPHKLVVEYYEEAEDAQIRVYWEAKRHQR